jgi:tricorn protease
VAESRFGQMAGVAAGDGQGGLDGAADPRRARPRRPQGRPGPAGGLRFRHRQRAETLVDKADHFVLAADHHTLLLREGKRWRAIAAIIAKTGARTSATPPRARAAGSTWRRIRVSVDPRLEWRQMLREVWRLQRDHFWVADMSGVDWPAMLRRYAPLLPRVATRAELSDLIWELQGELGTSHAYEMGGDHRKPPAVALGQLAAELQLVEVRRWLPHRASCRATPGTPRPIRR